MRTRRSSFRWIVGFSNVYGIPGLPGVFFETEALDGRIVAADWKDRVAAEVRQLVGRDEAPPSLATILVGDDPASQTYVAAKRQACVEVGIGSSHHEFSAGATHEEIAACIDELNDDAQVSGILMQLPLPGHLDPRALIERINPNKDVDGLTTLNMGRLCQGAGGLVPCTPKGLMELLNHYRIELEGRRAVVVGRSELVGRPIALMLTHRGATVTICHSRTRDLHDECRRAELLIVAAGKRHLIGAKHVRHGAIVVDVGIHRDGDGLTGDVDFDAIRGRAAAASPVPGGVGPMTIAALLANTVHAAKTARSKPPTGARSG